MNDDRDGSVAGSGAPGTPDRLLGAALESIAEHGLAGATSRDIARRAGTNLQAITYHFGSKDVLLAQALLRAFRGWIGPAVERLRSQMDPIPRMVGAVQALQDAFERSGPLRSAYLEALVQANRSDTLNAGVQETLGELRALLTEQIEALRLARFLPTWVEPDAMATLLLATADGLALHAALDPLSVDHHRVSAQAMQMLLSVASAAAGPAAPTAP
jgi:AcrR family transcriptional regulator